MPVEGRALGHLDRRLAVVLVEEAELDAVGVLGEEREVRARRRPTSARAGYGRARPDLISASSSTSSEREVDHELAPAATKLRAGAPPRRTRPRPRAAARGAARSSRVDARSPAGRRVELRALERLARLRVGHVLGREAGEARELAPAPVAGRRRRSNGSMWSVKNWNGCDSPYSSPMKSSGVRREEDDRLRARAGASGRQPVADGAVADLVVVLRADDEPLARPVGRARGRSARASRRTARSSRRARP